MITEAEFLGMMVIALCALIGLISAIVAPLINLNRTIERLNGTLNSIQRENDVRDKRINAHADQLDEHGNKLIDHEVRIKHLEDEK